MGCLCYFYPMRILLFVLCLLALLGCGTEKGNEPPEQAKAYFKNGLDLLQSGDYAQAIPQFDLAIGLDSTYFEAIHNKAICLWGLKQQKEAMELMDNALEINSRYLPSMLQKYFWCRALRNDSEMVSIAEQLVLAFPDSLRFTDLRAQAYLENKQYSKALKDFTYLIDTQPSQVEHLINRAMVFYLIRDYIAAEIDLNLAKKLAPFNAIPPNNLALVFSAKRAWQLAFEEMQAARSIDPGAPLYKNNQAYILMNMGRFDEAKQLLQEIKEESLQPYVNRNLAILAYLKGDIEACAQHLEALVIKHSEMEWAQLYLGSAYLLLRQKEKACASFEASVRNADFWAQDSLKTYCQ